MKSFKAKSVIISRKPGRSKESWTALIALFKENNPHLKGRVPFRVLEYPKVEKIRIKELRNISFYLAGNDLVINNLVKIDLDEDKENKGKKIITLTGKQKFPRQNVS